MNNRIYSIDILKFLAAILITNSHMELLYGEYSALATGGAIGDVLFFFCSGFTLFLGRFDRFDNWYKRRINRIYPTVFAWALMGCIAFGYNNNIIDIIIHGGGWFISCIMIYYILIYFIRKHLFNYIIPFLYTYGIMCLIIYFLIDRTHDFNMYGDTYFKWVHYFIFMLLGATIGIKHKKDNIETNSIKTFIILLTNTIIFYTILICGKRWDSIQEIQILSLIPLIGITYYFYKLCNSKLLHQFYNSQIIGWIIKFVGGLCLEIYLVQYSLFTDKMNQLFPFNIIIMFIIIVIVAYGLRCLSRIFSQTFKDTNYNWKDVFKLI